MQEKQLRALKRVRMSKEAKSRIAARLDKAMRTVPAEDEPDSFAEPRSSRWEWTRGLATGLAACMLLGVTGGMIYGVSRMKPPLSPATSVSEVQSASVKEVITPFGDITKSAAAYTLLVDSWSGNTADLQDYPKHTITKECLAALNEVFRVYGWREQAPGDPDFRITKKCIVMYFSDSTEPAEDNAITAYFQLDGDGQRLVQVDADGQSRWYDLDDEIIRCLCSIVMLNEITEYEPPQPKIGHIFSRCGGLIGPDGNRLALTLGQEAALNDLLCGNCFYEWNTLRELNPRHGRYIELQLMTNNGAEFLRFWLETGCVTYTTANERVTNGVDYRAESTVTSSLDYWIDDAAFMSKVERLLVNGIYPQCPISEWQEPQISADVSTDNHMWESMLLGLLQKSEWRAIECPVNESKKEQFAELTVSWDTNGMAHQLIFYPDKGFMEFTEVREHYEFHEAGSDAVSHVLSHYFTLTPELWADVQTVLEGGTPAQLLGRQAGAPFGSLSGAEMYFNTDGTGYFSVAPEHQTAVEAYLSRLTYEEIDWMQGAMSGGKYLNIFVNEQGFRHVLQVWSSGDIIEKRFDADGTEQRHWVKADGDPYNTILRELQEPETRGGLGYGTRDSMELDLPQVLAQLFPERDYPNLLGADEVRGILLLNGDEAQRFGVQLPEERSYFTFDRSRVQEVLDSFDWTPSGTAYQDTEKRLVIKIGDGQELWVDTVPQETSGQYQVCWWQGVSDQTVYLADEAFVREILTAVQDLSNPADSEGSAIVPDVVHYHYEYAKKIMQQEGFNTEIFYEASEEPASNVIRTEPEVNSFAEPGTTIKLYVSKGGVSDYTMEDCTGMTQKQAETLMQYYGMKAVFVTEVSDKPAGTVLAQDIPAGKSLPKGATITFTVAGE